MYQLTENLGFGKTLLDDIYLPFTYLIDKMTSCFIFLDYKLFQKQSPKAIIVISLMWNREDLHIIPSEKIACKNKTEQSNGEIIPKKILNVTSPRVLQMFHVLQFF